MHLTLVTGTKSQNASDKREAYVGWTGMASASSLAHFNSGNTADKGLETVEIDPQYAEGLGFAMGDVVSSLACLLEERTAFNTHGAVLR